MNDDRLNAASLGTGAEGSSDELIPYPRRESSQHVIATSNIVPPLNIAMLDAVATWRVLMLNSFNHIF